MQLNLVPQLDVLTCGVWQGHLTSIFTSLIIYIHALSYVTRKFWPITPKSLALAEDFWGSLALIESLLPPIWGLRPNLEAFGLCH